MNGKSIVYNNKLLLLVYFLMPSIMALFGALFYLPSWYYSLFKIVMVVDACISFLLYSTRDADRSQMSLFGATLVLAFIAFLGIISQFFVKGGFPKSLWVVLDIIYVIAKAVQYFVLRKSFGDND